MSIHVALHHKTQYTYDKPVGHAPHVVRLRPAPHCRTKILSYSQRVGGGEHFINWQQDPFSNWNARLVFPEKLKAFSVEVELVAEMAVYNPFDFFIDDAATHFPFPYEVTLKKDLAPFLEPCALGPKVSDCIAAVKRDILGHPEVLPHAPTSAALHRPDVHHEGGHLPAAGSEPAAGVSIRKSDAGIPGPLRTIDFLVALNQRLRNEIKYLIRLEPGVQAPEETLAKRSGSCRDSGWLLVQLLRHFGLAARFVSGYLIQLAPDVKSLDGPSGTEIDFTDLHAWCEVYLPGAGWIGFDPTSGLLAGEGHIPLSCTPEPGASAPVSGAIDECKSTFHHEMKVTRIHESPRVTKPYSEAQWRTLERLGHDIDAELARQDVRLTMGGEPTFISIDDPDGPEWNFTATSPGKRVLSATLLRRLRARFAPGSLVHYGQGKWYPGESLPRWAFGCYWRKDGFPIWQDDRLIADEAASGQQTVADSAKFMASLTARLGTDPQWILPGFEDPFYHVWKERRLPVNLDPHKASLKDDEERVRLAKILQHGLDSAVGHVLPIQRGWKNHSPVWVSGPWFLRAERLYLAPGDSPMGLRLPLDSLPWVKESDYPYIHELDPTAERPPLPSPEEFRQRYLRADTPARRKAAALRRSGQSAEAAKAEALREDPTRLPRSDESAPWIIRTALCVEPRQGRLHVFMPPVATLEDYLELVAAVEDTAAQLKTPVAIEGYTPPRDSRLDVLKVTPDPGVIEVNLHPSKSWEELVERTTVLYEEARQARLGVEKFMVDGRHTGTGGGNHILIGGETPADSPVLRRPDLLRSLIAYWQNHPSLSWLFSSLFIGPTSQAPRVDEARNDSLYELEVAFMELDRQLGGAPPAAAVSGAVEGNNGPAGAVGGTSTTAGQVPALPFVPPWLADRLFRDLLIDSSGNTHRAEFSIDKLYSPDGTAGRLGLVEMRAFEMPPHARMSLAQHLLLRGLISKFWRNPYRNSLVRWGTDLHDRWMLPHFCETDFQDVIQDLRDAGYPFEFDWFAPHFEFRFPRIGDFAQRDVQVELRTALEPWHVLGEEGAAGGTVRYVDSSLERLQVKARGLVGDRFALTVNGCRIPLHATGTNGEGVAGVRYRAWQPPNCLQPTIGVHAPLTFDLYDTWNRRSLGGCQYHVTHPGGRSYATFPVNAYEAESRRLARFFTHGATQERFTPPPERVRRELPFTLGSAHDMTSQRPEHGPQLPRSQARGISFPYSGTAGVYDEMLASPGSPRPHWLPLVRALNHLGAEEVQARGDTARRFLRENGVTYNIYGDVQGFGRTWELDPLPLLIPTAEWARIEEGLIQRTRLLGHILADIHGGQKLLHEHRLPPALIFANPAFLRPCRGIHPAGDLPIFLHAVDLMRSPDGQWWAMADRTQAPSGAGYALVNRIALSRAFPDEFRHCHVQRLASFFQVGRDTLRALAPLHRDNPHVVLLTPGPYNETYFEHAYLARYLGLALVEGGDLTVRDRRVFIKTLEGLRPVDVILRRVDDNFCDPLELRADSHLGVPGLVEAARAGNVVIANPLGSGVVETPALLAFLPGLCRHLLGEELKLPSVATWWCGQPSERRHVEEHLDEFIVKRAFPSGSGEPLFGRRLDAERREALLNEIRLTPHAFVGQEQVALSTAPAWQNGQLVPRPLVLRVYVCATQDGFRVMPGGLTRVSPSEGGPVVSTQSGGLSKDTWVLTDGPVSTVTLLKPSAPVVRLERRASEVPSRVADHLFWLGRYAERLEDTIRLLRVAVSRLAGESVGEPPPELAGLLQMLAELELFPKPEGERGSTGKIEKHLLLLVYQAGRAGSVREVLNRLRHSAFVVRDRFTADTWRIFNKLQLDARARPRTIPVTEALALLNTLVLDLAAFNGMVMENMTRGHGWLFLDIGRRLERALHLLAVLRAALRVDPAGQSLLEPVLEIADSVMTHRRRYFERPQLSGVLDLLLLDETNPRSLAFQINALAAHALALPSAGLPGPAPEQELLESASAQLESADLVALTAAEAPPGAMAGLVETMHERLTELSDALTHRFFAHADARVS